MKLIKLDKTALAQHGIPFSKATLYQYYRQNKLQGVFVKIEGRLLFDVDAFFEYAAKQKKKVL